jgi:hypothetical protein
MEQRQVDFVQFLAESPHAASGDQTLSPSNLPRSALADRTMPPCFRLDGASGCDEDAALFIFHEVLYERLLGIAG